MDLERQRDLLYQWFQGEFDNFQQWQYEKEMERKGCGEAVHDSVFSMFYNVSVPKIGTHVLLARQGFKKTGQVYRKRMYSFIINLEEKCVENKIYKLKDESLFDKARQDPTIMIDLDPTTEVECLDGCGVVWKYIPEENRFHGCTRVGTCRFKSTYFPGKTIIASSDILIGPDHLWTQDRGVDTDGNKVYGFQSEDHHKFLHCMLYKGIVRLGVDKDSHEVLLHNQGGTFVIEGTEYSLMLAQSIELDTKASVLRLSLLKNGEEEVLMGVALCDPESRVIGGVFTEGLSVYLVKQ